MNTHQFPCTTRSNASQPCKHPRSRTMGIPCRHAHITHRQLKARPNVEIKCFSPTLTLTTTLRLIQSPPVSVILTQQVPTG